MSSTGHTRNGTRRVEDDMETLSEGVEQLRDDAGRVRKRGRVVLEDSLNALYEGIADEGSRAIETVERNIEDHPWVSLGIGFGLGWILSRMLFGGRRD